MRKSEECYERAILADPYDGEVLSQYAKLQWAAHKDERRAEMYYDQAIQAAPNDWLVGFTVRSVHDCMLDLYLGMMPCMVCLDEAIYGCLDHDVMHARMVNWIIMIIRPCILDHDRMVPCMLDLMIHNLVHHVILYA